jgi:hypothetical protein
MERSVTTESWALIGPNDRNQRLAPQRCEAFPPAERLT